MDDQPLRLSIKYHCNTADTRQSGLMFKPPLKDNECAFFSFPYSNHLSFWNKNVNFDIVVIFVDEDFNIKDKKILKAHQTHPVSCNIPCKYAIEILAENFGKISEFNKAHHAGDMIELMKKNAKSKNFGNEDFQKIANSYYKSIR